MLEIQKQNEGKKLSVASELAFKVACLYKKSAGGVIYPRVKAGIGLWRMSVAFMYSSSSQCGIWHAFAAFLLLRREFVCSGERGGWEKKTMQGWVRGGCFPSEIKGKPSFFSRGEGWVILGRFRITKIHVFFSTWRFGTNA